ncbi:MAG: Ig-like domain-containing protein, partial [Desulfovibrionaceae bacterium]|nr:Ig-like domain-containing protein [Desulfovibrionaceae bacterium]
TSGGFTPTSEIEMLAADPASAPDALEGAVFSAQWADAAALLEPKRALELLVNDFPGIGALSPENAIDSGTLYRGAWRCDFGADVPAARIVSISSSGGAAELVLSDGQSSVDVAGAYGTLTLQADGSYAYRADPNSEGTDVFTLAISDADGDTSSAELVLSVRDSTQTFDTLTYDTAETGLLAAANALSVPDGVVLTEEAVAAVNAGQDYGYFTYDAEAGTLAFTQTAVWSFGDEESHTFAAVDFAVLDANGNRTVLTAEVTITDGEPDIGLEGEPAASIASGAECRGAWWADFGTDAPALEQVTVTCGDAAGVLTLGGEGSLSIAGQFGTLTVSADGTWAYRADPNAEGTDVFTFTVLDADGDAAASALTLAVHDSTQTFEPLACAASDAELGAAASIDLPDGVTLSGEAVAAVNADLECGSFAYDAEAGTLTFTQTAALSHAAGADSAVLSLVFAAADANGNSTTLAVELAIADDAPTLVLSGGAEAGGESASYAGPASADLTALGSGLAAMQSVRAQTLTDAQGGSAGLTVSAAVVVYTGETDAWGNAAYTLADTETAYLNYRAGQAADGLSVSYYEDGAEKNNVETAFWQEEQADGTLLSRSEAVVFDLDGLAYGISLSFLNLYKADSGSEGSDERALIAYYNGDTLVYSAEVRADSPDGQAQTEILAADYIAQGFDRVVVTALDNGAGAGQDNSDFTLESVSLVTMDDAILTRTGTVTAESGADGWLSDEAATAALDYSTDSADWDTMTVLLADGTVAEADQGSGQLTAVIAGADGEETDLFTVILSADGSWRFAQHTAFAVWDEASADWAGSYDIAFVSAADSDGDTAAAVQTVALAESDALDAAIAAFAADLADTALAAVSAPADGSPTGDGLYADSLFADLFGALDENAAGSLTGDLADDLAGDAESALAESPVGSLTDAQAGSDSAADMPAGAEDLVLAWMDAGDAGAYCAADAAASLAVCAAEADMQQAALLAECAG